MWAFAEVSVALVLSVDGLVVEDASIVLGGVATMPWRVAGTEAALRGKKLTEGTIMKAAQAATDGARPPAS